MFKLSAIFVSDVVDLSWMHFWPFGTLLSPHLGPLRGRLAASQGPQTRPTTFPQTPLLDAPPVLEPKLAPKIEAKSIKKSMPKSIKKTMPSSTDV